MPRAPVKPESIDTNGASINDRMNEKYWCKCPMIGCRRGRPRGIWRCKCGVVSFVPSFPNRISNNWGAYVPGYLEKKQKWADEVGRHLYQPNGEPKLDENGIALRVPLIPRPGIPQEFQEIKNPLLNGKPDGRWEANSAGPLPEGKNGLSDLARYINNDSKTN